MILIADSGSTKTDWRLIDKDVVHTFRSKGINPLFNTEDQIIEEINRTDIVKFRSKITTINFYGAGLVNENIKSQANQIFQRLFPFSNSIVVNDDLLGAARSVLGSEQGIACILGTGSNSCFYNGVHIVDKIPALGYILGDEGSGAFLGKSFLNSLFKKDFSVETINAIHAIIDIDMAEVIQHVYKNNLPNRYLASFAKIIKELVQFQEIENLVFNAFSQFIDKNLIKYRGYNEYPIGFVGSVAYHFKDILEKVMSSKGLILGKVLESPMESLLDFHKMN